MVMKEIEEMLMPRKSYIGDVPTGIFVDFVDDFVDNFKTLFNDFFLGD